MKKTLILALFLFDVAFAQSQQSSRGAGVKTVAVNPFVYRGTEKAKKVYQVLTQDIEKACKKSSEASPIKLRLVTRHYRRLDYFNQMINARANLLEKDLDTITNRIDQFLAAEIEKKREEELKKNSDLNVLDLKIGKGGLGEGEKKNILARQTQLRAEIKKIQEERNELGRKSLDDEAKFNYSEQLSVQLTDELSDLSELSGQSGKMVKRTEDCITEVAGRGFTTDRAEPQAAKRPGVSLKSLSPLDGSTGTVQGFGFLPAQNNTGNGAQNSGASGTGSATGSTR